MYSNELICNILIFLKENIYQKITVNDIAKKTNFDKAYIMRLFKKEIGITIVDYCNKLRIYQALQLIMDDKNNFLRIALKCGFYSQEYFSEIFKKNVGLNPRDYKNFVLRKKILPEKEAKIIINNIIELEELNNRINSYLKNKKPLTFIKVKKLY